MHIFGKFTMHIHEIKKNDFLGGKDPPPLDPPSSSVHDRVVLKVTER